MSETKLLHSDSWLLLATIYATQAKPGAPLTEIIAAADYINHAIITRGELETGFSRLISAGHLTQSGGNFSVSDAVNAFWRTTGSKHQQALKAWDALAAFIGTPAWAPGPLPDTPEEHYVTRTHYAGAVESYQRRMRQRSKAEKK